jgi:hypothetical protein
VETIPANEKSAVGWIGQEQIKVASGEPMTGTALEIVSDFELDRNEDDNYRHKYMRRCIHRTEFGE